MLEHCGVFLHISALKLTEAIQTIVLHVLCATSRPPDSTRNIYSPRIVAGDRTAVEMSCKG